MALTSTRVLIERAPQNGCHPCLCTQGELQLLPASLGHSPRSAGGSDPGFFQITASALGPRACDILCTPFRSGVSISHRPLVLLKVSPACLRRIVFQELIFLVQDHWGSNVGPGTLAFWGKPLPCCYPPICGSPTQGMGVDYLIPLLPVFLWFFLYIFTQRRFFPLVFWSFSSIVAFFFFSNFGVPVGGGELDFSSSAISATSGIVLCY